MLVTVRSAEGRLRETFRRWDRMWRLRAGLVTPSPGGLGQPSAGTTTGRLQWLDAVRTKAGGSLPDQEGEESSVAHTEVTVPGTEKPPNKPRLRKLVWVERREAPHTLVGVRTC